MTIKKMMPLLWAVSLLLFSSCSMQDRSNPSGDEAVKLLVNVEAVYGEASLKAQGNQPSINTDSEGREDFVRETALMVYESSTGNLVKSASSTTAKINIELPKGGVYDFYFLSNYPEGDKAALLRKDRADLETYMKSFSAFSAYNGVETDGYFPMARVYKSQDIKSGNGTEVTFRPTVNSSKSLAPVSSYGSDADKSGEEVAETQNAVRLVRAVAKVSLDLKGRGLSQIEKVEYFNAADKYSLMEMENSDTSMGTPSVLLMALRDGAQSGAATTKSAVLYVPERLFGTTPSWNRSTDNPVGHINYIKITMISGIAYRIPIISDPNRAPSGTNYMKYAKGNASFAPKYDVIRNKHYKLEVDVPHQGNELIVSLKVMPWDYMSSTYSYARPTYSIKVFAPGETTTPLNDIKKEVELVHPQSVTIKFSIKEPKGQRWAASITNAMDFELKVKDASGRVLDAQGDFIVGDPANPEYTMTITPRKPFTNKPRYTQFLIAVGGKELYLGNKTDTSGAPTSTNDERFMRDGEAVEWSFKQVMP